MVTNFAKTIRVLSMAMDRKSTIPHLAHIHQSGGRIWATDLDMVASLPSDAADDATYDRKGNRLATPIDPGPLYPTLAGTPKFGETPGRQVTLPTDFLDALRKVRPAISTEETRYYLNGVYFDFSRNKGQNLALVAAADHRLHRFEWPEVLGWESKPDRDHMHNREMCGIVPRQAIDILLTQKGGDWQVTFGDCVAEFIDRSTGFRLATKLIDGSYPDYPRVIPQYSATDPTINGNALEMLRIVKGFDKYGTERNKAIKIDGAHLSMQQGQLAALEAKWTVQTLTEYPYEFGFNQRYLRDALEVIGNDSVTIRMLSPLNPARFCPGDDRLTVVLMPLRV